jgi:hypothetical protein
VHAARWFSAFYGAEVYELIFTLILIIFLVLMNFLIDSVNTHLQLSLNGVTMYQSR